MSTELVIEARGLTRRYATGAQSVHALRGLDLELERGDYLAITGASGSGKSTLLHILACLDRPTTGSYLLAGRRVADLADRELARLRSSQVGIVFQTFNLVPELSVLENVTLPFLYSTLPLRTGKQRAQRALERVGLAARMQHRPQELSGGEMQRVAIARALAVGPALILADEPTGNLDSATGAGILALFDELHAEGKSLVVVTHDEQVATRASRRLEMRDGREHGARAVA